jgi:hypothetical protein
MVNASSDAAFIILHLYARLSKVMPKNGPRRAIPPEFPILFFHAQIASNSTSIEFPFRLTSQTSQSGRFRIWCDRFPSSDRGPTAESITVNRLPMYLILANQYPV